MLILDDESGRNSLLLFSRFGCCESRPKTFHHLCRKSQEESPVLVWYLGRDHFFRQTCVSHSWHWLWKSVLSILLFDDEKKNHFSLLPLLIYSFVMCNFFLHFVSFGTWNMSHWCCCISCVLHKVLVRVFSSREISRRWLSLCLNEQFILVIVSLSPTFVLRGRERHVM